MNAALRAIANAQGGTFTTQQALTAGYAREARRRAVASGHWVHLFRGAFADSSQLIDIRLRARAALLVLPRDAVISHETVLELMGVAVGPAAGSQPRVHVTIPHHLDVAPRPGIVIHRGTLPKRDLVMADGLPQTTATRAVLDAARYLPLVEGVVLADAALHQRVCSLRELDSCLTGMLGLPGVIRAREVRLLADARAESPMETRLRLVLLDGGLPTPAVQFNVLDREGRWIARVDLAYVAAKVAIEFDGRDAHDGDDSFVRDRERQNALVDAGWIVLRYVGRDVYRRAPLIISQVRAVLQRLDSAA